MYRRANRSSFLGRPGSSCLATVYGKLVALEIVLNDQYGPGFPGCGTHNLPLLLEKVADHHANAAPAISPAALRSKAVQLANMLRALDCLHKNGSRMKVPPGSYPYIRYVMHELDGAHVNDVKEAELLAIGVLADDVLLTLANQYQVQA